MYVYVGKYQCVCPTIICKLYSVKRECGPRVFLPLKCDPSASKAWRPLPHTLKKSHIS
jgi:hypothetical protein